MKTYARLLEEAVRKIITRRTGLSYSTSYDREDCSLCGEASPITYHTEDFKVSLCAPCAHHTAHELVVRELLRLQTLSLKEREEGPQVVFRKVR